MLSILSPAALAVLPFCLIGAAVSDIRRLLIPNEFSLGLIGGFLVAAVVSGLDLATFGMHVAVGAAALVVGFALFAFRICGAGDSKLLAATALWMGPGQIIPMAFWMSIAGAVLVVVVLAMRFALAFYPGLRAHSKFLDRVARAKTVMTPYGVAIAAGALIAFPQTTLFSALMG